MSKVSRSERVCVACRQLKPHASRGLCNACYKHHLAALTHVKFPPVRENVSPRARYEGRVASGLTTNEYARQVGILNTSLSRALRQERQRRDRLGLPWLTGWRKVVNGLGSGDYGTSDRYSGEECEAPPDHDELHREAPGAA